MEKNKKNNESLFQNFLEELDKSNLVKNEEILKFIEKSRSNDNFLNDNSIHLYLKMNKKSLKAFESHSSKVSSKKSKFSSKYSIRNLDSRSCSVDFDNDFNNFFSIEEAMSIEKFTQKKFGSKRSFHLEEIKELLGSELKCFSKNC